MERVQIHMTGRSGYLTQLSSGDTVFNLWGRVIDASQGANLPQGTLLPLGTLCGMTLLLDGSKNANIERSDCCLGPLMQHQTWPPSANSRTCPKAPVVARGWPGGPRMGGSVISFLVGMAAFWSLDQSSSLPIAYAVLRCLEDGWFRHRRSTRPRRMSRRVSRGLPRARALRSVRTRLMNFGPSCLCTCISSRDQTSPAPLGLWSTPSTPRHLPL